MSGKATDSTDREFGGRALDIDLPGIWQAVWRKRVVILGTTAACFALAVAFVVIVKPRYTGEAKVLVENQESYFTRPDRTQSDQTQGPDQEAIASQVQVVTSRDLGREAIRNLGLKGNSYYDPLAGGGGVLSNLLSLVGLRNSPTNSPEDRILENYFDALAVFPVPKSRVLQIEFKAPDADLAAKGANTIADLYIDMQSQAKRERAKAAAESLAIANAELRKQVSQSEARLEAFRASTGLMLGSNNTTLPTQALSDINGQLAAARSAQAEAQAKARLLRDAIRSGRVNEMPDIAKDELIRRVSEQRINLRGQLALESRTLGPQHPRIKDLNAQLATVDADLRTAVEKSARSMENESKISGARVENLLAAVDQQRRSIGNASGDEVRLRELERELKLQKEQLEGNIAKYQEAVARQESQSTPGDARVISRAVAPQLPSFPKKIPIIVLATVAGFVLSLGSVLMREFLSGTAYMPDERDNAYATPEALRDLEPRPARSFSLRRKAKADESGTMPDVPEQLPFADTDNEAPQDQRKSVTVVARRLLDGTQADYATRVMAISSDGSLGSHDTAYPLARELASEARTILIDFCRAPSRSRRDGLSELLNGEVSFEDVIHRDRGSRLHVLEAGEGRVAIGSDLEAVIDALSQTYEFLVLSAPPVSDDGVAKGLAPAADFVCVVASAFGPKARALGASLVEAGAGEAIFVDAVAASGALRPGRRQMASIDAA